MAGLGEACSHIAAVLFYLEALARMQGTKTCTQEECQWIIPSYLKTVEYLPIKDIDFTSAKGKKRKLDEVVDGNEQQRGDSKVPVSGKKSTESELALLFENLSSGGTKPGILSLVSKFADSYVPKSLCTGFPQPLNSLKEPSYLQLSYHELLAKCELVSVEITKEMAEKVEQATRSQSHSKLWFKYRAGRITASRMKAVCRTNPGYPAQSLIKSICYPETFSFATAATKWGCKHEKQAQEMYLTANKLKHNDLSVAESGLVINSQWPFIGASPDGVINCTCCGKGVLEIKCPYCHRGTDVQTAATEDSGFCLKIVDGQLRLDRTHTYYYQIQSQLFVCDVEYGDFCVCTFSMNEDESQYLETGMHIERIYKDPDLWTECTTKSSQFFKTCLLPEIMGNWYTRPSFTANASNMDLGDLMDFDDTNESTDTPNVDQPSYYCYCQGPEEGTMIACDNPDCPIEWFHTKCLRLQTLPKGKTKWYCPDCRKLSKFLRGKGKK